MDFLAFIIGFFIPVLVAVILYFTVFKKQLCIGDTHHCPAADIDICVKKGTSDADWQSMCSKLAGGGGFKPNNYMDYPNPCVENLRACQLGSAGCYGSNQACVDAVYSSPGCTEAISDLCQGLSKPDCVQALCGR